MTAIVISTTQIAAPVALACHNARWVHRVAEIMLTRHDPARDGQRAAAPVPSVGTAWCFHFCSGNTVENCRRALPSILQCFELIDQAGRRDCHALIVCIRQSLVLSVVDPIFAIKEPVHYIVTIVKQWQEHCQAIDTTGWSISTSLLAHTATLRCQGTDPREKGAHVASGCEAGVMLLRRATPRAEQKNMWTASIIVSPFFRAGLIS